MSLNGKISSESGRYTISGPEDMERVKNLRRSVDGVLVGANTVLIDNPILHEASNRIVLDGEFKLSEGYKIFDGSINTYIFSKKQKYIKNVNTVLINNTDIYGILEKIYSLGMETILVEGGAHVISQFLKSNLFDEFYVYINPGLLLSGRSLFPDTDVNNIDYDIQTMGEGILLSIKSIHIR
jgi:riboflavin-specific deaminase-like protein